MNFINHYKINMRDIEFNLFEFLKIQETILKNKIYADIDINTVKDILESLRKLSIEQLSSSYAISDQVPLRLDQATGTVHLPIELKKSIKTFYENDWHRLSVSKKWGGFGYPEIINWANFEMIFGSNSTVGLYLLSVMTPVIMDLIATEEQQKRFIPGVMDKHWAVTMVLTEADAGSDVGAGRCKAEHIKGDEWYITGTKRFITGGDFDVPENIIHLVLARPVGAPSGTKGLSMFIVPKFWVNKDGELEDRNGVFCTKVEKKMGIKGSATCEMTFGDKMPARGLLIGNTHNGISQMFKIIEQARTAMGFKSMSLASTAYLHALEYTKERIQGVDLAKARDNKAPKINIIKHPDVRRMLMLQKSGVEGMRALCYYCAHISDQINIKKMENKEEAKNMTLKWHLLLPLLKGYNSEKAFELINNALQCFGGAGYLQDYPIEQYLRDQKIDSLYEGTTHIQSLDLIFRKIAGDGFVTFNKLFDEIEDTVNKKIKSDVFENEYKVLGESLRSFRNVMNSMMAKISISLYYIGLHGNNILFSLGEIVIGWLLLKQGEIALNKLEDDKISQKNKFFYKGKISSVLFYYAQIMPEVFKREKVINNDIMNLMDIDDLEF